MERRLVGLVCIALGGLAALHGRAWVEPVAADSAAVAGATEPNLKVAFIGDQGDGSDALAVLRLVANERADLVLHQGDFDYGDNPTQWDANITSVLGANFPYFASVGNHDTGSFYGAGGYQDKLEARLARVPEASCSGDLGVKSACTYKGLFFVLSGIGTTASGHEAYLDQQLAADQSIWRICSWHKNQNAMQVGGKGNDVGWLAYETCRNKGAIVATAHEHSYERTKTLVSMQNQTVDPAWPLPGQLRVAPGATFVFVSGLGGQSIRDQERCLPTTYPYGCKGEWASLYTSNQGARYGALFVEFYVDGIPNKARGYFKNVNGAVIDSFEITSEMVTPDPNNDPPLVDSVTATSPVDEGATTSLSAHFTDPDETDTHTATINWGDGAVQEGAVSETGGEGTVTGVHAYRDNAAYAVTVTVSDLRGGSGSGGTTVTVDNVAPTANAGGPYTGFVGSPTTLTGSASDPGAADVLTYQWDLDYNGTSFDIDRTGRTVQGTFTEIRTYTLGLRVLDDDGGESSVASATVRVDPRPPALLYFSLGSSATLGGLSVANEDIVAFDGANFSLHFDGSDVGAGSFTIDAFAILSPTEILLSFTSAGTVGGVSMDDSDVLKFTATSLGATTAGTFSMYFDGSDVGLSDGAEDVDAIELLPNGHLLVSTTGSFSVSGVSGADEDLLEFTHTSLGANTAGTWSLYFDGSDVGLASSSDEDVDALAVDGSGRIYLSTVGSFGVSGLSGADEDVFVFTPSSLGSTTAGTFGPGLFFDGSLYGLGGNDVFGIDLP
jgi:hypothetical protein